MSLHQESSLQPGTLVDGRYRITRKIGQGGFAMVYLAEHSSLGKSVALKVLDLTGNTRDVTMFRTRFQREAQLASKLEHPNIVRIYDFGFVEQNQQPYMAMEYLEGHDLEEELLRFGPLDPERALRLFQGALSGLGEAHKHSIVHKDLKPSNLFITNPNTPQERMVVLDFGIARLHNDPDGKLTQTSQYTGTPAYAAPEYIHDQTATPALDVYQMGLILGESLSGTPVVQASSPMAYLVAHCNGQQRLDERLIGTPIAHIIRQALSVDPQDRYQDALEFLQALNTVPVESIPNLSGVGYVSPQSSKSQAPLVHQATMDSMPAHTSPDLAASQPPAPMVYIPTVQNTTSKGLLPLVGVIAAVLIIVGIPMLAGVSYLVYQTVNAPDYTATTQLGASDQVNAPPTLSSDEQSALKELQKAQNQQLNPTKWQRHYRQFQHTHQAYRFICTYMEYSHPFYLTKMEGYSHDLEHVSNLSVRHEPIIYKSTYAQVISALSITESNEALNTDLSKWRSEVEKLETISLDMSDYWYEDKLWKGSNSDAHHDLDKRLKTHLAIYDKYTDTLLNTLRNQERQVFKSRLKKLKNKQPHTDIIHALLAIMDLQEELRKDPFSRSAKKAYQKAHSAYKVARRSVRNDERPAQIIPLPDEQNTIDSMHAYFKSLNEFYESSQQTHDALANMKARLSKKKNALSDKEKKALKDLKIANDLAKFSAVTSFIGYYHDLFVGYYTLVLEKPKYEALQKYNQAQHKK